MKPHIGSEVKLYREPCIVVTVCDHTIPVPLLELRTYGPCEQSREGNVTLQILHNLHIQFPQATFPFRKHSQGLVNIAELEYLFLLMIKEISGQLLNEPLFVTASTEVNRNENIFLLR